MADTRISPAQQQFIESQNMFFVATAPSASDGHVNLSPKGVDGSLVVVDDQHVAYLDFWGSGIETVAHLRDNGRICLMFCSFDETPNILRLHGRGRVIEPSHHDFPQWRSRFPDLPGARTVILISLTRICDSCGFGVPRYEFIEHRTRLTDCAAEWGPDRIEQYTRDKNHHSIDDLPGIDV